MGGFPLSTVQLLLVHDIIGAVLHTYYHRSSDNLELFVELGVLCSITGPFASILQTLASPVSKTSTSVCVGNAGSN